MFKSDEYIEIKVYFSEIPQQILDVLEREWDQGGPERMGELLIKAITAELFTSKEIAKRMRLTQRAVTLAATDAKKEGREWPIKNKGEWVAPLMEWEKIFAERALRRKSEPRKR